MERIKRIKDATRRLYFVTVTGPVPFSEESFKENQLGLIAFDDLLQETKVFLLKHIFNSPCAPKKIEQDSVDSLNEYNQTTGFLGNTEMRLLACVLVDEDSCTIIPRNTSQAFASRKIVCLLLYEFLGVDREEILPLTYRI